MDRYKKSAIPIIIAVADLSEIIGGGGQDLFISLIDFSNIRALLVLARIYSCWCGSTKMSLLMLYSTFQGYSNPTISKLVFLTFILINRFGRFLFSDRA